MSETQPPQVAADVRRLGFRTERTIVCGDTPALRGRHLGTRAYPQRVAADVRRQVGRVVPNPPYFGRNKSQRIALSASLVTSAATEPLS